MKQGQDAFKEIGRIQLTDSRWLVLSELTKDKEVIGLVISKYVESPGYTGFEKGGGTMINAEMTTDFLAMFGKQELEWALEKVNETAC